MAQQYVQEGLKRGSTEYHRRVHQRRMADPAEALKLRIRAVCRYAINTGKLVRGPCEGCGKPNGNAHHADYSKPLEVQWLCRKCHKALHHKKHCARGHALTSENTDAGRRCKTCSRLRTANRHNELEVRLNEVRQALKALGLAPRGDEQYRKGVIDTVARALSIVGNVSHVPVRRAA